MPGYGGTNENVGCPLFLGKVVKNWYEDQDCFYDHYSESIIFHKSGKFIIQFQKKSDESQKIMKFNIGTQFERIYACGLNHDGTMLACQPTYNTVYVFNNSQKLSPHGTIRKQYEIEEYRFEYKNSSKILGFSFASSTYFNFFICTETELELLNFNKFSSNVVHVKKIQISGYYLFYELHLYNILTLVGKDGTISVIDFTKNPRTKNIVKKNGRINYDQSIEDMDNPSSRSSRMSISDRAMSFFKNTQPVSEFKAVEPINNKNMYLLSEKNEYIMNSFGIVSVFKT